MPKAHKRNVVDDAEKMIETPFFYDIKVETESFTAGDNPVVPGKTYYSYRSILSFESNDNIKYYLFSKSSSGNKYRIVSTVLFIIIPELSESIDFALKNGDESEVTNLTKEMLNDTTNFENLNLIEFISKKNFIEIIDRNAPPRESYITVQKDVLVFENSNYTVIVLYGDNIEIKAKKKLKSGIGLSINSTISDHWSNF